MSEFAKHASKPIKFAKQAHYDVFVAQIVEEDGSPLADASEEAFQTLQGEGYNLSYVFAYTTSTQQAQKDKLSSQCKQLEKAAAELYKTSDKGTPVEPNCLSLTLVANTLKKALAEAYKDCSGRATVQHLCADGTAKPVSSAEEEGEAVWRLILGKKLVHTLISLATFTGYEKASGSNDDDADHDPDDYDGDDSDGEDPEEDHLQYLKALISLAVYIAAPAPTPAPASAATGTAYDMNGVLNTSEWGMLMAVLHINFGDLRVAGPLVSLMHHCQAVAKAASTEALALDAGTDDLAWAGGTIGFDTTLRAAFDAAAAAAAIAVDAKGKRLQANTHVLQYVADEVGGVVDLLQRVAGTHKRNELLQQQVAMVLA